MGQALYRKQRPRSFDEVVGQEHIINTLKKAIKSGRISHAYLFTGPRGVGKTSVARILAHEINELPYTDESIHLDIIEIDAASNRRIDEIRDLRDRVHSAPTSAKYKVYIIDEVHMLTREAFNALLKTLEEPPAHCIFILATTESHKLPETIVSRTQRFEFKPVGTEQVAAHLGDIAKKEGLKVDKPALDLLARYGEGSFRDSISLLDQLSSSGDSVDEQQVRDLLGLPPASAIKGLVDAIGNGASADMLNLLDQLRGQGVNAATTARLLAEALRQILILGDSAPWLSSLLKQLIEVPASNRAQDNLEICLLEACLANKSNPPNEPDNTSSRVDDSPKEIVPAAPIAKVDPPDIKAYKPSKSKKTDFDMNVWEQLLETVKKQAASLYTALRLAEPSVERSTLILAFQFPLHQKKVNQAANKDLIAKALEDLTGQKLAIECSLDQSPKPEPPEPVKVPTTAANSSEPLQAISNIFGGAEVLES